MSKVVFFFAGTGDDCEIYSSVKENQSQFHDDVIRIYLKGCHEERVGNGFLFPDLEIAANNVRNAFVGNELNLDKLRANFGDSLYDIRGQTFGEHKVKIDSIMLEGFSRGAVTTFATAKKLDDLNIPMHIIANQPVPGEPGIAKRLYSRYCDLTDCRNIKSAHTFLASYNLEQGVIHNHFFRQMVAKFAPEVNAQQILFPHQHHMAWFRNTPIHSHINKLMTENNFTQGHFNNETRIKNWYQNNSNSYFTPYEFMQTIYGATGVIGKDPIYLKMIVENAKEVLARNKIVDQDTLNSEQAAAILAITRLPADRVNSETKIKLYELILKDSKRAEKFIAIVNKITEVCDYLPHATKDISSRKSQLIRLHAPDYKKAVFLGSYELLAKNQPSKQEQKHFADLIQDAECQFRKQALGIDRGIMRIIFKLLANFITHVTGVAIIVNTANKLRTGNWSLFQHTRSTNVVRDARQQVLRDMDKLDVDSEQNKTDYTAPSDTTPRPR